MQQPGTLGHIPIQAHLMRHDTHQTRHLDRVRQGILPGSLYDTSNGQEFNQLSMHIVDAQLETGIIARFLDLHIQVLCRLSQQPLRCAQE
ncbi:MAG: hypothetical protein U5N85_14160, partial [Arcicella sp.]|nr:hypothetical protein [Arcicella sp.]